MQQLAERKSLILIPDSERVLCQFFDLRKLGRSENIFKRVKGLSDSQAALILKDVEHEFAHRHKDFPEILKNHFAKVLARDPRVTSLSENKRLLLGAYYSNEYAMESSALMNPSLIVAPENNEKNNTCSFIMSLRAVGEGHISSLEFRSGEIDRDGTVIIDPVSKFTTAGINQITVDNERQVSKLSFRSGDLISEKVIFPVTEDESNGIEDVRFVRFETGSYYGTYTAFDGHELKLKLIETEDFNTFLIHKLMGGSVSNKGMALFPKKIDGQFVMTSRQDGENLYLMYSNDILSWQKAEKIAEPKEPWEFVQLGNCGSPLETEEGWILITHGVGPMRKYVISACLLDIKDPSKIIARLKQPLLSPIELERNGYVPNVVYSCGSLIYNKVLYIPYAMSDYASGMASISMDKLMENMI